MIKSILTAAILIFIVFSVYSQDYLSVLKNKTDYDLLCGDPLTNKYGKVTAVKIVYDLKNDSLYFLSSHRYKNHYVFCEDKLNYIAGMGNFFKRNYSNGPEKKYLLANINYFQTIDKYVIDLSPIDLMTAGQIIKMYELVKNSTFASEKLCFLISNPRLKKLQDSLITNIAVIEPSEIYGNLTYQPISKFDNTGVLRIVEDIEKVKNPVKPNEIIILKTLPNYLPAVAGVIVTEFQTPLSHISILGQNRKIPICAYTNIFNNTEIKKYLGKQVRLTVKADTFLIEPDTSKINNTPKVGIDLKADLSVDSLIDIQYLNRNSSSVVGTKATNFAILYDLSKNADFMTPECAFAIPFYFYVQHTKKSRADRLIHNLIHNIPENQKRVEKMLLVIRKRIINTHVDPVLLKEVEKKMTNNLGYSRFRFRSSTNAEDLKGFSGAGLYASKTGELNNPKKSIEKAIQSVWASLWSYQAFSERVYFNINHENLAMGILVHRSFQHEKVNGVAITKNIYRNISNGFLVNAQLGDESVVRPKPGVTCDQFICFPAKSNIIYKNKIVIDILTYSSLNDNQLVMSEKEIQNLANQLEVIKKHFTGNDINTLAYLNIGYDVEFKLDGKSRQLYIKQVRPYND